MPNAALYVRRSTDDQRQPESLEVQETRLRAFAAAQGLEVVAVFADSASGLSTKGRSAFTEMVSLVERGKARFSIILVRDVSRWGRWEADMSAYFEMFFFLHGVTVRFAEESFESTPKPYDALLKTIRRITAAEFSREKSRLIQAAQAHATAKGFRVLGPAPFGMRRVVVAPDGKVIGRLAPGVRKGQSAHRVKLEPERGARARTVRSVFDWYVNDELSFAEIARRLNSGNVASPSGNGWLVNGIRQMLENPAYGGICRQRFQKSENFSEPTTIEKTGAWKGVVPEALFRAAATRLSERPRQRPVDEQLRTCFAEWGRANASDASWEAIRGTFPHGAIDADVAEEIAPSAVAFVNSIAGAFETGDTTPRGILLNGVFELGVRYSFPRLVGRSLSWEFRLSQEDPEDATLFIAVSPPPDAKPVRLYLIYTRRLKRKGKVYRPPIDRPNIPHVIRPVDAQDVVRRIEANLYSGPLACAKLLAATKGMTWVNTAHIARTLGWPEGSTYWVYSQLRLRGVALPPLVWHAKRRVTWLCDTCGAAKELTIRGAARLKRHDCEACRKVVAENRRRKVFTCRVCGAERRLVDLPVGSRYEGGNAEDAMCRSCAGKRNLIGARKEYARRAKLLHTAYGRVTSEIVKAMKSRRRDPRCENVDGVPRLVSYALNTGERRYVRVLIRSIDVAAQIVEGRRRAARRVAGVISRDRALWMSAKRTAPTSVEVDPYVR